MIISNDEEEVAEIDPEVYKVQNTPMTMATALIHGNFEWDFQAVARVQHGRCQLGIGTSTLERTTFRLMGEGATWAEALRASGAVVGGSGEARRRNGVDRADDEGKVRVTVPKLSSTHGRAFQRALLALEDKPVGWETMQRGGIQLRLRVGGAMLGLYERIMKEIE